MYAITSTLANAFEAGDQRKEMWLKANLINGENWYYPFKYKARVSSPITEYLVVLRLAEVVLIRAEARVQQNNLPGAVDDLNMIRKRAGLGNTSAGNKEEIIQSIEDERQTELFVEWGHRWFDLKRTNHANAVLGILKAPNWQPSDVWYPIPLQEIQRNPALVQNEGY
jgi:hypothetical protein